ncbi:OLC1v1018138C1 [Oldenlandia corymbosa var. corymbosa]|uniref:OLC1v1018138C1 n=1 Tax=Oldenlandia corymbosa var. corymbosa TaxID=529605 RepID=A0AAV1EB13_OLDCO|nr:OLC1v1018138C1 [Oldenlandia corymbosa var. corymbosa]
MEILGLCPPSLMPPPFLPPSTTRKLYRLNAVTGGSNTTGGVTSSFSVTSRWAERLLSDFQFLPSTAATTTADPPENLNFINSGNNGPFNPPVAKVPERAVEMPIDFYRILGAEAHFLGDGIKRAYEAKLRKPPQYGYSEDALVSRSLILQAASETLANATSRREYNQGLAEYEYGTIVTEVPWDKVPGALCVLQEAGEAELVLQIGERLLKERLHKSFKQDVVLAMALAYVDKSRDAMALTPPDFIEGSELLGRALKLLQEEGATGLAPDLQAQIDETLEEINPLCVLELLSLPLDEDFRSRRAEGLQGVRNILWSVGVGGAAAISGGFTREDFMNEAFLRMTAAEQVDLFAAKPSNIPAESFEVYGVAIALVALALVGKKPHLIKDADDLFQKLQQSMVAAQSIYPVRDASETDFAVERGLCSLLVGDIDECRTLLGLDSESSIYRDPSIVDFVVEHSRDDEEDYVLPGLCKLLETWLMKVVFPRFRDTQDIQFKLGDYYDDPKVLRYLERFEGGRASPLAAAAAIARIGAEATAVIDSVKMSALQALQKVFPLGSSERIAKVDEEYDIINSEGYAEHEVPSSPRDLDDSAYNGIPITDRQVSSELQEQELITQKIKEASVKIMCAGVAVGLITLCGLKFIPFRNNSRTLKYVDPATGSDVFNVGESVDENPAEVSKMDARLAEHLVRKWQDIKSQALGPDHCLQKLPEVRMCYRLKFQFDMI